MSWLTDDRNHMAPDWEPVKRNAAGFHRWRCTRCGLIVLSGGDKPDLNTGMESCEDYMVRSVMVK